MKLSLLGVITASALVAFSSVSAQIQIDDFNSGTLSSFWRFNDPLADATQTLTGTQASIAVPAGLSHEPRQFGENFAPRLVQQIATPGTDFGDLEVFAKFDATMNAMYQLAGIEVVQDASNYVRAELFSDGTDVFPLIWSFADDGSPDPASPVVGTALPTGSSAPFYLRLKRVGSTFTLYWSTTSGTWTLGATLLTHTMNADSVGVFIGNSDATNPGTAAPAFTGLIDFFTTVDPLLVPVQLGSFTASIVSENRVKLDWMTVSETNNFGFNVQKSREATSNFVTIENSFIPGHGTSLTPHFYSFTSVASPGRWFYRLEQIDLDGSRHYTEPVQVDVVTDVADTKVTPAVFTLKQNYPNPFNPSTVIGFSLPREMHVKIEVFNLIGQKVATALDAVRSAGTHQVNFDAAGLTSGVYVYKILAGTLTSSRRMVLMR